MPQVGLAKNELVDPAGMIGIIRFHTEYILGGFFVGTVCVTASATLTTKLLTASGRMPVQVLTCKYALLPL